MEVGIYLNPVKNEIRELSKKSQDKLLGQEIIFAELNSELETIDDVNLAIIGVEGSESENNSESYEVPDKIREKLYVLSAIFREKRILDLGNLKPGISTDDSNKRFIEIFSILMKNNISLIILGGSVKISYAVYRAYSGHIQSINISAVDPRISLLNLKNKTSRSNLLKKILADKNNYLFNYTNIGYQKYFVNPDDLEMISHLHFNAFSIGKIRTDIREIEPEIRDSDYLYMDISAIRQADAPGSLNPSPNGFFGEEACQIAKYAGISDRLNCFGLYEIEPDNDNNSQTINLASQIIWYFIEGYYLRKNDYPKSSISDCKKFIIDLNQIKHPLIFNKSHKSDRWWMEIPSIHKTEQNGIIVACSIEDYQKACNQEIPDRWLKAFNKIN